MLGKQPNLYLYMVIFMKCKNCPLRDSAEECFAIKHKLKPICESFARGETKFLGTVLGTEIVNLKEPVDADPATPAKTRKGCGCGGLPAQGARTREELRERMR